MVTLNIDLLWISLADENSEVPLAFLSEVIASKTCSEPIMNTLQPMLTYISIGVSRDDMFLREFHSFSCRSSIRWS